MIIKNQKTLLRNVFKLIKSEQQNILMMLLSYIKHALGFDSELRIDTLQEEQYANYSQHP